MDKNNKEEAGSLLRKALRIDRTFVPALLGLRYWHRIYQLNEQVQKDLLAEAKIEDNRQKIAAQWIESHQSHSSPFITFLCGAYFDFIKQNYDAAVKLYRKAAERGNAHAQSNLGYCYDNGEGVTTSESA